MARYNTNEQTVNCTCGVTFSIREFVRVPSFPADGMWDRYCPNCNSFWGAAPHPPTQYTLRVKMKCNG